jgi:hypothetical protein
MKKKKVIVGQGFQEGMAGGITTSSLNTQKLRAMDQRCQQNLQSRRIVWKQRNLKLVHRSGQQKTKRRSKTPGRAS